MSLATVLYEWYKKNPSKTFLGGDRSLTYQQVVDEVRRTASLISPGETVAHIMFNSTRSVINYLSVYWAGGKVVAIDPLTSAEDLKFILEDSQPSLVFTDNEVYERERTYKGL